MAGNYPSSSMVIGLIANLAELPNVHYQVGISALAVVITQRKSSTQTRTLSLTLARVTTGPALLKALKDPPNPPMA